MINLYSIQIIIVVQNCYMVLKFGMVVENIYLGLLHIFRFHIFTIFVCGGHI